MDTPAGLYNIANKAVDPAWHVPNSDWAGDLAGKVIPGDDPSNPIKARWLGIYDGVGIHGTPTTRRSARPPPTAACACTSRTSRSSTTRFRSALPSTLRE